MDAVWLHDAPAPFNFTFPPLPQLDGFGDGTGGAALPTTIAGIPAPKQEEGVCAPAPDEPAPEESADEDRVAAMPDTPKIAKPSREELALRAKQADRKKAFAARRCRASRTEGVPLGGRILLGILDLGQLGQTGLVGEAGWGSS